MTPVNCLIKLIFAVLLFGVAGCANVRVTDPPRTATEQFLLSRAVIESIEGFSFDALFARRVYVLCAHIAPSEENYVMGELRAALLQSGVQIADDPNDAEIIVEVRSSGVGIDRYENLTGIPPLAAPAGAAASGAGGAESAAVSTLITPELALTKNIKQFSFASIAYVAYWRTTGEIVASEGPSIGRGYREDWWFLGMGPRAVGDVITTDIETQSE